MTKTIVEGNDPFAEPPPLKKRLIKGLLITVGVIVVAIGGLGWFRFQPAFTQPAPSAIAVIQPAWGTATAVAPPAAAPVTPPAENTAAATANGASGDDAKAATKPRTSNRQKAQAANAKRQSSKTPPSQIAKVPN